jgi:hypothetical protein
MSSIVVNVNHGQCMVFGGTFDPAYTLAIHALPSLMLPTTNKRNAALIQKHVADTLGVPPSRGYVRFVATPEENVAIGGKTIAAEMDEVDRGATEDHEAPTRKASKASKLSTKVGSTRTLFWQV